MNREHLIGRIARARDCRFGSRLVLANRSSWLSLGETGSLVFLRIGSQEHVC